MSMIRVVSAALIGGGVVLLLGGGLVALAAVTDYSNQSCWDFPDADVGNCSDARDVVVLATGAVILSALTVAAGVWGVRRG